MSNGELEGSEGARTVIVHEGTCVRCNTDCTRRPGERWCNQYGRDECRAADDDGTEHDVPVWTVREGRRELPPPEAAVIFYGLNADGQTVIVNDQRIPVIDSTFFAEEFAEPATVTSWRISFSVPAGRQFDDSTRRLLLQSLRQSAAHTYPESEAEYEALIDVLGLEP